MNLLFLLNPFSTEIVILRPLKDMASDEILLFNQCYNLQAVSSLPETSIKSWESIDKLVESKWWWVFNFVSGSSKVTDFEFLLDFVLELQKDYPSTIDTIARTAEKLSPPHHQPIQPDCYICGSSCESETPTFEQTVDLDYMFKYSNSPNRRRHIQPLCYGCKAMLHDVHTDKLWETEENRQTTDDIT